MQANPFSQHSIPAPVATVPNTPEQRILKSINGEGVKNSRKQGTASTSNVPDGRLCFRCKQLGHLKKDCTKLPYCSKCQTRGHIQAKCPTKQQNSRQQDKRCAGNHRTHDCPRQQPYAPPTSNPANDAGIYQNNSVSK